MPKKIIMDCDPGHDDAIALLLAHGSPEIELLAVTTVVGNQTLDKVTRNALSVARIAGISGVPFAAGCPRPLVAETENAASIHGESGLDGPVLPEPTLALDPRHGVQLIIDTIMSEDPGTVTVVPTAGLTNIARAARLEPRIVERVREVVLMGGAYGGGNWSAVGEFNIVIDPEAAHIVFGERWPLTMIGLDVTHQALATPDVVERIAAVGTGPSAFVVDLLAFYGAAYTTEQGFEHPPVHDPCAVARVIDPSVVPTRPAPIAIELAGRSTRGMTVVDLRGPAPDGCTTQVGVALERSRFWDLLIDALERIGDVAA
jgi:purine nucleosidase